MTRKRKPAPKARATGPKKKAAAKPRKPAAKQPRKRRQGEHVKKHEKRKIKDAILASLQQGAKQIVACEAAGVGRVSFWRWCKEDKDFAKACMQAEATCVRRVEGANFLNALRPDGYSDRKLFLERRRRFSEPPEDPALRDDQPEARTDATGKPELESMNDDQLEKYISRLEVAARRGD